MGLGVVDKQGLGPRAERQACLYRARQCAHHAAKQAMVTLKDIGETLLIDTFLFISIKFWIHLKVLFKLEYFWF